MLGDPPIDVVTLGVEGSDAGLGAPGVPGLDVVEVGPSGVASEAHEEGGRQAPGRVVVELRDTQGTQGRRSRAVGGVAYEGGHERATGVSSPL